MYIVTFRRCVQWTPTKGNACGLIGRRDATHTIYRFGLGIKWLHHCTTCYQQTSKSPLNCIWYRWGCTASYWHSGYISTQIASYYFPIRATGPAARRFTNSIISSFRTEEYHSPVTSTFCVLCRAPMVVLWHADRGTGLFMPKQLDGRYQHQIRAAS
jgi:hypothetical protein